VSIVTERSVSFFVLAHADSRSVFVAVPDGLSWNTTVLDISSRRDSPHGSIL